MTAPIYDATVLALGTDPLAEADVVAEAEALTRQSATVTKECAA